MAKTTTLTELKDRIRNLADFGDSGWMDDTNLEAWINLEFSAFRDLMVEVWPEALATSTTDTITSGTDTYSLPADFFYLCGVDVLSDGSYFPLEQAQFTERAMHIDPYFQTSRERSSLYYVVGSSLVLTPVPGWNGTIKIWYVPSYTDVTTGSPNIDGVNGWESMIIFGVLGHIEGKRGGDPSYWMRERARAEKRIKSLASARALSQPRQIRNVDAELGRYPYRFGRFRR